MATTILIVDDHPGFRRAVRAMLEADGFVVVGEAADATETVAEVGRSRPDVVLLDIQLPGANGFVIAERLAVMTDPPTVILISSRESSEYGGQVEAAPAAGFIAKSRLSGAAIGALLG